MASLEHPEPQSSQIIWKLWAMALMLDQQTVIFLSLYIVLSPPDEQSL